MARLASDLTSLPPSENIATRVPPSPVGEVSLALVSMKNILFVVLVAASIALFWTPLRTLLDYSLRGGHQYDQYSHTLLIPLVSLALAFLDRKKIFANVGYGFRIGGILLLIAVVVGWASRRAMGAVGPEGSLSIALLGLAIFWMGGFILCYGSRAFGAGAFPLLFLLLTVPLPSALLNIPVAIVQRGSAEIASLVFSLFGVPVFRDGFTFALPGLTIEVAKECSGIHSIFALLIISLLAGHLSLLAGWKRLMLALLVFPIVCSSNGLRIGTLALLSTYVDPRIMQSSLHRDGGILFFLLGLGLLMIGLHLLRKVGAAARASDEDEK